MPDTRRVALCYIRKSFVKSGQSDPASPELQSHAASERATALGLTVEEFVDADGHRSGKTGKRAGWQALQKRLGDADVGALIVYSHDRAWRNLKELLNTADECLRLGVKFILVKDGVDVSTAQGRFLLSLLGSFAEFESNITGERRAAAIDWVRREHGQHMGLAPFGTERRTVDGHLRLAPSEQRQPNGTDYDALTRLYTLYAEGRLGYTLLVEQLNREGWRFRSAKGAKALRPWTHADVRRVLYNHWLYAGWIVRGRAGQGRDFELIEGNHGAVLPEALTAAVSARLEGHRRGWRLPRNLGFGLSGLVYCVCGAKLTGLDLGGNRRYYRHARHCDGGQAFAYAADELEAEVRARLKALAERLPANFRASADKDLPGPDGNPQAARRAHLEASLERARELYIDGDLPRAQYETRRKELTAELDALAAGQAGEGANAAAAALWLADIDAATPAEFQAVALAFYERLTISGETRCPFIDYQPREWCAAWA